VKAEEFDKQFDDSQDISDQLGLTKVRRPLQKLRRVNIVIPVWMIASLDKEAK